MRDVVICEPPWTPVGGFGGSVKLEAHRLAARVIRANAVRIRRPRWTREWGVTQGTAALFERTW